MPRHLTNKMCKDQKAHVAHPWTGPRGGSNWCPGHRLGLWRKLQLYVPAKIKKPFFQEATWNGTIHIVQPEGEHRILWYLSPLFDANRLPGPRFFGSLQAAPLCQNDTKGYWLTVQTLLDEDQIVDKDDLCEDCLKVRGLISAIPELN